ncbi:MAG TPA: hypothetical protein VN670_02375 [Acidobacteriaceae bacterium]|nr:hypothetical protein [Acidobacteriaceae bacterium]
MGCSTDGGDHRVQEAGNGKDPISWLFGSSDNADSRGLFTESELKQFVALNPIKSHTHIYHPSSIFNGMINRLNLHLINILVIDNHDELHTSLPLERAAAMSVIDHNKGRMKLCTSFDQYKFSRRDFANGAIAVKIY